MAAERAAWYNPNRGRPCPPGTAGVRHSHCSRGFPMAKPHRRLKKANHGARPANSKARKAKRKQIRT